MTTEEKLDRFKEICIEDARAQLSKVVTDFKNGLESTFSEHCEDERRRQEMRVGIETEKIERETKKELSMDQLRIKRRVSKKHEELKAKLFDEVSDKIHAFRKTEEYKKLIAKEINDILSLAGEHPCDIFLDKEDGELIELYKDRVKVSNTEFLGGTVGIIPDKNIVIDNSFRTKLEAERNRFSFEDKGEM
ncbi:MAG: ATPase [Eubacteriales bacterium]|nr:ATPase [Eubacteriales bacterium]